MLVVITLISMLFAITVPAVCRHARAAARPRVRTICGKFSWGCRTTPIAKTTGCAAATSIGSRDGAVTEVGWVADCVSIGTLPGKMLCPSNEAQVSRTISRCSTATPRPGSARYRTSWDRPRGRTQMERRRSNPCRKILGEWSGGGCADAGGRCAERHYFQGDLRARLQYQFRSELVAGSRGRVVGRKREHEELQRFSGPPVPGDEKPTLERHFTTGPLNRAKLDRSGVASSIVPLLGDAAAEQGIPAGGLWAMLRPASD